MSVVSVQWVPAYVGIGSNLDDPLQKVRDAFSALARIDRTRLVKASRIYRTAPFGPIEQPHFYNAAAGLLTQLPPVDLLRSLKALEHLLGREVSVRWGPRVIDFDLLAYGDVIMQSEELTLPHAGLLQRSFAILPLADVAPDLQLRDSGRIADLAEACDRSGIECVLDGTRA